MVHKLDQNEPFWCILVPFNYCWTMGYHVWLFCVIVVRCNPYWTILDPIRPNFILDHFVPFCWYLFVHYFPFLSDHLGYFLGSFFTLLNYLLPFAVFCMILDHFEYFFWKWWTILNPTSFLQGAIFRNSSYAKNAFVYKCFELFFFLYIHCSS